MKKAAMVVAACGMVYPVLVIDARNLHVELLSSVRRYDDADVASIVH